MVLVALLATYLPWLLVLFLLIMMLRAVERDEDLRPFYQMGFGFLSAAILVWLIKSFYYFPRPLASVLTDSSFPSAHATIFMTLAVIVWSYRPRWGWFFLLGAFLIGGARVLAGFHWPTDVLAGWLLGGLVGTCVVRLFRYNQPTE